jgi:hypothetical protein
MLFESLAATVSGESVYGPQLVSRQMERCRIEHVAQLLPIAVGLTLLEHGWQLEANPGLLYFHKDGQKLNVFEIVGQLRRGSFPREQWFELSRRLGIADLIINVVETKRLLRKLRPRPDR